MQWELLEKYLNHECDPDELKTVEGWIDSVEIRKWTNKEEDIIEEKLHRLKDKILEKIFNTRK